MLKKWLIQTVTSIALIGFFITAIAAENPYNNAFPAWQNILAKHVDAEGRIDFVSLKNQSDDLEKFVKAIEQVSPEANPDLFPSKNEVIAYHVNAYNALAMWGVLERDIPKNFSSLLKRASFFKFRKVVIGGKTTNLLDYETKVIRPLGEARTHFALNCMVKDCPRLPQTAFNAATLDQELEAASREFFAKDKHILIKSDKKEVHLSGIMKFYTKDYVPSGKKQDLVAYVNQFRDDKIPEEYKVKFIKYDWTINQQPAS